MLVSAAERADLTRLSSGRPKGRFAPFGPTLMSNRAVVEDGGHNTIRASKPNNRYCWLFRYSEGHVVELIEDIDTALSNLPFSHRGRRWARRRPSRERLKLTPERTRESRT
jgi:hypothetical protein